MILCENSVFNRNNLLLLEILNLSGIDGTFVFLWIFKRKYPFHHRQMEILLSIESNFKNTIYVFIVNGFVRMPNSWICHLVCVPNPAEGKAVKEERGQIHHKYLIRVNVQQYI